MHAAVTEVIGDVAGGMRKSGSGFRSEAVKRRSARLPDSWIDTISSRPDQSNGHRRLVFSLDKDVMALKGVSQLRYSQSPMAHTPYNDNLVLAIENSGLN